MHNAMHDIKHEIPQTTQQYDIDLHILSLSRWQFIPLRLWCLSQSSRCSILNSMVSASFSACSYSSRMLHPFGRLSKSFIRHPLSRGTDAVRRSSSFPAVVPINGHDCCVGSILPLFYLCTGLDKMRRLRRQEPTRL